MVEESVDCRTVNSVNRRDVIVDDKAILSIDGLVTDAIVENVTIEKEVDTDIEEMVNVLFVDDAAVYFFAVNSINDDTVFDSGVLVNNLLRKLF
ncbi:hypothetical protein NDU88_000176 [Pleurodeles waltl]|uniref:Uncharacterized protein n=1 Tax=Pleurodeles waltl TaxID=8319 RepID=A0AAV7KQ06_PLEWA|nr:hypothetical protein NDU88_000176 [Pleurodeles waltl]